MNCFSAGVQTKFCQKKKEIDRSVYMYFSRSVLIFPQTSLYKTLWEKEKLLVTSNFSFSRRVF